MSLSATTSASHNNTITTTTTRQMDRQSAYSLSLFGESTVDGQSSNKATQQQLVDFILSFHLDDNYVYRTQLRENVLSKQYYCDIDIAHLIAYNEELADRLSNEPGDLIPIVRNIL